ncbi:hypothetical protein [Priestia koreensis]|uniref:hypothetical protein n=1 Tax=Priestia koreensis TaxID=284581 RepID=UPI001F5706B2|nr:hypothetical protein [Priestia koreensis]UNL82899.1 hypothetical protein IE339_11825 [Priestia koreensis]
MTSSRLKKYAQQAAEILGTPPRPDHRISGWSSIHIQRASNWVGRNHVIQAMIAKQLHIKK